MPIFLQTAEESNGKTSDLKCGGERGVEGGGGFSQLVASRFNFL